VYDFARFGAKSYAINKINSVEVRERHPYGMTGAFLCGLLAIVAFASVSKIIALLPLGAAYWFWRRAQIKEFLLFLMTSSSETQAFLTRDAEEVEKLRHRIETAMIRHSQGALRR
jgi:hypothetical protein